MKLRLFVATALVALSSPASAGEKTTFNASNGVVVNVNSDSFAERYEYSAPTIKFSEEGSTEESFALVAKIKTANKAPSTTVQGYIYYKGEWHYYVSAIFKGGVEAKFTSTGRDVSSCRYGCSYNEGFMIDITPAEVAKYSENGVLAIQLRSKATRTAMLKIPVSYFDAVNEASK
jgi:hypothetical protein